MLFLNAELQQVLCSQMLHEDIASYLCSYDLNRKISFSVSERDKMCWDCPSTVILHFSALSHRIDSFFLTSTPSSCKNTFLPSGSLF